MKPTLLFATLSMVLASPTAFAKTELEILRSRCSEQERQIRMLEDENTRLRGDRRESPAVAKSSAPSVVAPAAPTSTVPATYTVRSGDSFGKIARKVGTSPQKLAKMNGLKTSSIIQPGQRLKVPGSVPVAPRTAEAVASTPKSGGTHKVRAGDTFSSISKKHGMSTAALIAANPRVKPSALRPGQLVNLGGSAATAASTPVSTPIAHTKAAIEQAPAPMAKAPAIPQNMPVSTAAPAPSPAPAVSAPAPAPQAPPVAEAPAPSLTPEKKIRPVTIEGEMTYGDFAAKHGTDAERLNALNGLDLTTATVLAKGSELYVPAQP
jgi:LysM repeat protein